MLELTILTNPLEFSLTPSGSTEISPDVVSSYFGTNDSDKC